MTPRFQVGLLQCPTDELCPPALGSSTFHLGRLESYDHAFLLSKLDTTCFLSTLSSGFSRILSFAQNWQRALKTSVSFSLKKKKQKQNSIPSLALKTYISCCYVWNGLGRMEWIGQNSRSELQEDSFVLHCTLPNMREATDKDLAVLKVCLE